MYADVLLEDYGIGEFFLVDGVGVLGSGSWIGFVVNKMCT